MLPAAELHHQEAGRESSTANKIRINLECMRIVSHAGEGVSVRVHPATQLKPARMVIQALQRQLSSCAGDLWPAIMPLNCPHRRDYAGSL